MKFQENKNIPNVIINERINNSIEEIPGYLLLIVELENYRYIIHKINRQFCQIFLIFSF